MSDKIATATPAAENPPDRAARCAGVLLLLTALFTVAMVYTRVTADADQAPLLKSLQAVAEHPMMYIVSGIARAISGLTMLVAGWLLLHTWIIRGRWATPIVPYLFVLSGSFTVASGAFAILIASQLVPEAISAGGLTAATEATALNLSYNLRWITGKLGFSAAGIALAVAARYQWRVGGTLRRIAPVSATLGVAMQFIWLSAPTGIHPVVGTAFLLWLITIGTLLASGRVERQYSAAYGRRTRSV